MTFARVTEILRAGAIRGLSAGQPVDSSDFDGLENLSGELKSDAVPPLSWGEVRWLLRQSVRGMDDQPAVAVLLHHLDMWANHVRTCQTDDCRTCEADFNLVVRAHAAWANGQRRPVEAAPMLAEAVTQEQEGS